MPPLKTSRERKKTPGDRTAEFERLLKRAPAGNYVLRLFVTGSTPRSAQAIANIRALCDENLAGHYDLEVVDIYQQPTQAFGEQIIAAPTLVKRLPSPVRRLVGNFSDRDRMLVALDINQQKPPGGSAGRTKWMQL